MTQLKQQKLFYYYIKRLNNIILLLVISAFIAIFNANLDANIYSRPYLFFLISLFGPQIFS